MNQVGNCYTIMPTSSGNGEYSIIPINNLLEFVIAHRYANTSNALNSVMEVDEVLVINLTELFGQGREESKEGMDNFIDILGGWFGVK